MLHDNLYKEEIKGVNILSANGSNIFFQAWASNLGVQLIYGCGLYTGFYSNQPNLKEKFVS